MGSWALGQCRSLKHQPFLFLGQDLCDNITGWDKNPATGLKGHGRLAATITVTSSNTISCIHAPFLNVEGSFCSVGIFCFVQQRLSLCLVHLVSCLVASLVASLVARLCLVGQRVRSVCTSRASAGGSTKEECCIQKECSPAAAHVAAHVFWSGESRVGRVSHGLDGQFFQVSQNIAPEVRKAGCSGIPWLLRFCETERHLHGPRLGLDLLGCPDHAEEAHHVGGSGHREEHHREGLG